MVSDNNSSVSNDTFEFMKKEWDLSWAHINNIAHTYWALFLSIIAFNGIIIKHYLEKDALRYSIYDGIVSVFVLTVNSLILLIYQREHYSRKENYFTIHLIRKNLCDKNNSCIDWNHFYKSINNDEYKNKYSALGNCGYTYYTILNFLFIIGVPLFIYLKFFFEKNVNDSFKFLILFSLFIIILALILTYLSSRCKGEAMIKNFDDYIKIKKDDK